MVSFSIFAPSTVSSTKSSSGKRRTTKVDRNTENSEKIEEKMKLCRVSRYGHEIFTKHYQVMRLTCVSERWYVWGWHNENKSLAMSDDRAK